MARVALVSPTTGLRGVLVETADLGLFEPDDLATAGPPLPATAGIGTGDATGHEAGNGHGQATVTRLSTEARTADEWRAAGRADLARGEVELARLAEGAVRTHRSSALLGWLPREGLSELRARLLPLGGAVAELPPPRWRTPPTALRDRAASAALRPLVTTYATVPYRDIDPTWFAGLAYLVMFGMMFGDVGHGLALALAGLAIRRSDRPTLTRLRAVSPFLIGAGVAAAAFGLLYGEAFGPTGLVPTLWLRPLDQPESLLVAGLVVGSTLLAITFILGTIDRWREGGPALALYASSGIGGALLFAGAAALVGGLLTTSVPWLVPAGLAVIGAGAALTFVGLIVGAGGGGSAIPQAIVELFDTVLRLGSNVVSFSRLAAFGLTHAVISGVVWDGTTALWDRPGLLGPVAALALLVVGNVAAFALGALVGAIQALRLEYYEMFSRLFAIEGRPFEPWSPPVERSEPT
jgi:V/A-type H+-transporting ATPase subunit I